MGKCQRRDFPIGVSLGTKSSFAIEAITNRKRDTTTPVAAFYWHSKFLVEECRQGGLGTKETSRCRPIRDGVRRIFPEATNRFRKRARISQNQ